MSTEHVIYYNYRYKSGADLGGGGGGGVQSHNDKGGGGGGTFSSRPRAQFLENT